MHDHIIYLNGPSSSGKTTLAKALQNALEQPFLHIGLDTMIDMMPEMVNNWTGDPAPLGFSWKKELDETGHPIEVLQEGPFAKKLCATYRDVVKLLAQQSYHLIIDDVAFGKPEVDLWREKLKDFAVLWVGVEASLEDLEAREKKRGDRIIGSARAQYYQVHKAVDYDLMVNTSTMSMQECVNTICAKARDKALLPATN